ncbi:hypothetical protein CC78DRAFT_574153 [Lojkania enalia]|uniref:Uncharacterized protein n=1 Tax=Lojkania enalia TaxID=147567 RepID=A0A9P4TR36_9PLEO|nr:hypothetical protein CC78DRAFT_574153 [Didymosphaeria enalia]
MLPQASSHPRTLRIDAFLQVEAAHQESCAAVLACTIAQITYAGAPAPSLRALCAIDRLHRSGSTAESISAAWALRKRTAVAQTAWAATPVDFDRHQPHRAPPRPIIHHASLTLFPRLHPTAAVHATASVSAITTAAQSPPPNSRSIAHIRCPL